MSDLLERIDIISEVRLKPTESTARHIKLNTKSV